MLLKECYEAFGGDYESVRDRIPQEEIIRKFLIKFLSEPSYDNLCKALAAEEYTEAFRAVHSLKGVCQNLGFDQLQKSSSVLTELLRNSMEKQVDMEQCKVALREVNEDYKIVIDAITRLAAGE